MHPLNRFKNIFSLFLKKNDLVFDSLKYHELTVYRQENRLTNEVFSIKVALTDDLKSVHTDVGGAI